MDKSNEINQALTKKNTKCDEITVVYLVPCQISMMNLFEKIVNE